MLAAFNVHDCDLARQIEAMAAEAEAAFESRHAKKGKGEFPQFFWNASQDRQEKKPRRPPPVGDEKQISKWESQSSRAGDDSSATTKCSDEQRPQKIILIGEHFDSHRAYDSVPIMDTTSDVDLSYDSSASLSSNSTASTRSALLQKTEDSAVSLIVAKPAGAPSSGRINVVENRFKSTSLLSVISLLLFVKGISPFAAYVIFLLLKVSSKCYCEERTVIACKEV